METEPAKLNRDLRLRKVEPAHICDLIRLGAETNLSQWSAQNYLDEIKNSSSIMYRLETGDNATIGFIVGRTVPSGTKDKLDAEIYNLAVQPCQQRNGFGQILFNSFSEICSIAGVADIWLEVRESNDTAIRFYERNGFERVQTRNHFYENPREHAILMKRALKS